MPSVTSESPTSAESAGGDTALASALRLSVVRLNRRLRAQRADQSVTLTQLAALSTLKVHGPLTPGELAAHEKVQPPSMTRVVAALEAAGVASRTPHPTDRRQVLVAATPAGVALLAEDRRRRDAWLAQQLQGLPDDELAVLARAAVVLDRLAAR